MSTQLLGGPVDTISNTGEAGRRRRRYHSPEFKAEVVAACGVAGVSVAAVALAHGVNASLARGWMRDAKPGDNAAPAAGPSGMAVSGFVPVQLPPGCAMPTDIRVELRRGATTVNVSWPSAVASECAAWMRELLR